MKPVNKSIKFIYNSCYNEAKLDATKNSALSSCTHSNKYDIKIVVGKVKDLHFSGNNELISHTGMSNHLRRAIDTAEEYKKGKNIIIGGSGALVI